jgi:hypothetical protein
LDLGRRHAQLKRFDLLHWTAAVESGAQEFATFEDRRRSPFAAMHDEELQVLWLGAEDS